MSGEMSQVVDARLRAPMGLCVSGPGQSGKTTWCLRFIDNLERLVDQPIKKIFWFYGNHTKTIELLQTAYKDKVTTVQGLPENFVDYIDVDGREHYMHIFDDLLRETTSSKALVDLTSRQSSHNLVSWILILQDLFYRGPERVTLLRNCHYIVQFRNPLNNTIPFILAQRILPQDKRTFMNIFRKATSKPNGYLLMDGAQQTSELLRLRTEIFGEYQICYVPKALAKTLGTTR